MGASAAVEVRPIEDDDIDAVAAFMHAHMSQRVPADDWAAALRSAWQVDPPNHGFQLRSGGRVVGAYLAIYSTRSIGGATVRVCNMAGWCVVEEHRSSSVRLLRKLLDQKGYEFTDLSPSGNVVPLNQRLRFQLLDTGSALVPNLPWPTVHRPGRLVTDRAEIGRLIAGPARAIFEDHAGARAARHALFVAEDGEQCYVVYRHDRRRNLPLFASILFVSDPALLPAMWPRLSRHLLVRRRVPFTLLERRVGGWRPRVSRHVAGRPKMFRSAVLEPHQIDYLYSELVALSW